MSKNFLANSSYSLAASSSFSFKASLSYLDISFSMNSFYTFSFISLSRASMSNDSIKSLIYCLDEKEDKNLRVEELQEGWWVEWTKGKRKETDELILLKV